MTETKKADVDRPKMRKVPRHAVKVFDAVHLYLDDLVAIEAVFRRVSNTIVVIADDYEFDAAEDLRLLNKPAIQNELEIRCRQPLAALSVKPSDVTIYIDSQDDIRLVGLMSQVGEILQKRATPTARRSVVSIALSTDPQPPQPQKPPAWLQRNRDWVVPIVSAAVGAF